MRRSSVLHVLLCLLGMAAAVIPAGCGNGGGWADAPQSWFLFYKGNLYMSTSVTVASAGMDADVPSKLMYVGQASLSATANKAGFGVYLIRGLDENEAIATRYAVSGGHYWYVKYERLYGQVEPPDFVYNDSNYEGTGEIGDFEKLRGKNSPPNIHYLNSVEYQGITYDVYSVYGRDESQEIALKIAKAGKTLGFYSLYFRYVRE